MYVTQLQISPGCVILCTPGDKSMVCQRRPKLPPGCRILWGVSYIVYVSYIVSDTVPRFQEGGIDRETQFFGSSEMSRSNSTKKNRLISSQLRLR